MHVCTGVVEIKGCVRQAYSWNWERLGRGFPCLLEGSMYQSRGDVFVIWETEPSVVCIEISFVVSILFVIHIV